MGALRLADPEPQVPKSPPSSRAWAAARPRPPALTLVLDEAMSCQELQRVNLEEHAVEEQAVRGRPARRVAGQAAEDELLRRGEGGCVSWRLSALDPQVSTGSPQTPRVPSPGSLMQECAEEGAS